MSLAQNLPFGGCTQATCSNDTAFLHSTNWENDCSMLFAMQTLKLDPFHDTSSPPSHEFLDAKNPGLGAQPIACVLPVDSVQPGWCSTSIATNSQSEETGGSSPTAAGKLADKVHKNANHSSSSSPGTCSKQRHMYSDMRGLDASSRPRSAPSKQSSTQQRALLKRPQTACLDRTSPSVKPCAEDGNEEGSTRGSHSQHTEMTGIAANSTVSSSGNAVGNVRPVPDRFSSLHGRTPAVVCVEDPCYGVGLQVCGSRSTESVRCRSNAYQCFCVSRCVGHFTLKVAYLYHEKGLL